MIPAEVITIRKELCPACAHLAHDPCAACEHGAWGEYMPCESPQRLPPITEQARNFISAMGQEIKAIATSQEPVSETEIHNRINICSSCEHFRHQDQRCSLCGCFMAFKARLRSQDCPIGKW
jgi:hypothetical protein